MPWKDSSLPQQRLALVRAALLKRESISALAQQFGVSRKTVHKWIKRHAQLGVSGMQDESRAPALSPLRTPQPVIDRLIALRHAHPTWGPRKLRTLLVPEADLCSIPDQRTLARYLQRAGLSRRGPRRARPGPVLYRGPLRIPQKSNDVWTVDFKGAFRTGDGRRCDPLTVRDLFSRMVLGIEILPDARHATMREAFSRLFTRFGLPATIRVDNGQPFASAAPYGCTALSLWWMRLGIHVDFIRPACPQDNGSHEQFHRVYKAETLRPPAASLRAQAQRSRRWLIHYNTERPHEALGLKPPASLYRKSPKRYRPLARSFAYPRHWKVYRVGPKGYIRWRGRIRLLSRILAGERVGLGPTSETTVDIYLEKILLGTLHADDLPGMRPVTLRRRKV